MTAYLAADQDGYDGGWCAKSHCGTTAHGATEADALRNLVAMVMPGEWRVAEDEPAPKVKQRVQYSPWRCCASCKRPLEKKEFCYHEK